MEEKYKPSPIFYMGNKYKLLKQLIPYFLRSVENLLMLLVVVVL